MFEALSDKLTGVFDRLRRRGALSETDVGEALREVRLALLDADVALPVVRDFIVKVRDRALGSEVLHAVTPARSFHSPRKYGLLHLNCRCSCSKRTV